MKSATYSAVAIVLLSISCAAFGERALVRTVTTSAIGESFGVYIHTVDLEQMQEVGMPLWLPGDAPVGGVVLNERGTIGATAINSIELGSPERRRVASFGTLPVPPLTKGVFGSAGTGPEFPAGFVRIDDKDWLVTYAATTLPGSAAERGTIAIRPIGDDGAAIGPATRQLVPGVPAAGLTSIDRSTVAVLAWDRESLEWAVHVTDPSGRAGLRSSGPLPGADRIDANTDCAALGQTADGTYLLALITGSIAEQTERDAVLIAINIDSLKPVGDPLRIQGIPDGHDGAIVPANGNGAWIVTRDSTAAFGFAAYVEVDRNGPALKDDPTYTGVDAAPVVAHSRESNVAAIAAGHEIEFREPGGGVKERRRFAAPVRSLAWHGDTVLVGEGGRLHRLDPSDSSNDTVIQFQSGRVDAVTVIPGSAPIPQDSDGDGLLDGVDPDVRAPTPVLIVAPEVRMRASAAGYEVRLNRIDSRPRADGRWSIQFDKTSAPWLRIDGLAGVLPGGPQFRLDPGALPLEGDANTIIEVSVVDFENRHFAGSPGTINVLVDHSSVPARRIAWAIGDPANRARVSGIAESLSAAPFHFTHDFAPSGASLDASTVAIAVMDESAAAQSIFTRRSVAEFVRAGGSLVFLRAPTTPAIARTTATWLGPFGVTLADVDAVTHGAATDGSHPLARWWRPSWNQSNGRAFAVDAPASAVLAADDHGVYASTGHYGLGRVAVFASPSPMFDSGREQRRFALETFAWLARASSADEPDQRDTDGDGLTDWLEDRSRDGVHDPGETDWMNPDTDGDGVPDGGEDVNLNGALDAGETSPLNHDTDGDGVWDGADATPIPPFAAPIFATVYPNTAPAQGGRTITIQGRNLRTSQRVWLGDRLASDVRAVDANTLSVVVPPLPLQSTARVFDIRIEDTDTGLEHTAAGVFTYTDPALVRLELRSVPEASGPNLGVLTLRVTSTEKVAIGRVVLTLGTTPPNAMSWGKLDAGIAAVSQGRSVAASGAPDGALSIAIGATRHAQGMGELVTIPWAINNDSGEPVRVEVRNARITADNGYPLRVDASAAVDLP